jgi:hypothetical protein
VLLTKYYSNEHIKKNETGGTCDTYRREERFMEGLVGKHEGEKDWKTQAHRRR